MRGALAVALTTAGTLCAAPNLGAQSVRIRAARTDTIIARSAVTAAFTIANQRTERLTFTPVVEAPSGWTVLMGSTAITIAADAMEVVMVSVMVPAKAAAGTYAIRVTGAGALDSAIVRVPQRRLLEVSLMERPGFVVSGKSYDANFLVRNRGNAPAVVRLSARSTLGAAAMADTSFTLLAEEARTVAAHVRSPAGLSAASDDVLEVFATQFGETGQTQASARGTRVAGPIRPKEGFIRGPTRV